MTFDQAALTDMFRQGFAGLNTLGSGQLALAQAQQERGYAERQEAMRREMQRQAQLEMLGVQNQFATDRQRQENEFATTAAAKAAQDALALQRQRGIDATTTAKATARAQARGARNTAKKVRGIEYSLKLRERATNAGIDPALDDASLEKAIAAKQQEQQDTADSYYTTLTGLQTKADELATQMQVSDAERLAVAKQILIGDAEGDKKKIAAINKLTSINEESFNEITGPQFEARIGALEKTRALKYEKQARALGTRLQTAQRGLDTLARRDIIPRLGRPGEATDDFSADTDAGMGMDLPPPPPPLTGRPRTASTNWLTPLLFPPGALPSLAIPALYNWLGREAANLPPPAASTSWLSRNWLTPASMVFSPAGIRGITAAPLGPQSRITAAPLGPQSRITAAPLGPQSPITAAPLGPQITAAPMDLDMAQLQAMLAQSPRF